MAKQRVKSSEEPVKTIGSPLRETTNSAEIAALAYQLWQARGCPVGSPEIDWLQAEQQLRPQTADTHSRQVSEPLLMRRSGS